MARAVRIEYEGAVYHVLCRGDRREEIFRCDADRELWLETLAEVCKRTGFLVHSYVLMANHYHILVETPEANLVVGMKWFQGTYTQRFNRRYGLSGHLFQGRYKAIHVEADKAESFRRVSDYIHLNPARARLLKSGAPKLEQYPWSSYGWFTGSRSLPAWLIRSRVFESHDLPDAKLHNRRRYAGILSEQVADVIDPGKAETNAADFAPLRRGWYVGGDSFRDRLLDRADRAVQGSKRSSFHADGMRRHDEKEAERRLEQALTLLGVRLSDLWRSKQTNAVKQAVAWYVKHGSTVGDEWLCTRLEMGNRTNVHRAVRRFREAQDPTAKAIKRKLRLCAD